MPAGPRGPWRAGFGLRTAEVTRDVRHCQHFTAQPLTARVVLCPEMVANVGRRCATSPNRKRRAVAECAEGRTVAEVAAKAGAAPAEVERWCAAPDFIAAVRRYRFGWSPRRRAALALLVRSGPPWLTQDEVAAAVGVSRRTLCRWRSAPPFAAAVEAVHLARAQRWEAARQAEADRQHAEALARMLRRVRRGGR